MNKSSIWLPIVLYMQLAACNKEEKPAATKDIYSDQNVLSKNTRTKSGCPLIDPSNFVNSITNPYFPLKPGTVYHYINRVEEDNTITYEQTEVSVLPNTKMIEGVACQVVHDVVKVNGKVTENTYDWYAQDKSGNVWYMGEHTKSLKEEHGWTTEGSWKAGTRHACAGIIMWADPQAHAWEVYYQEYLPGIAEDQGQVVNTNSTVTVPYGTFTGCVKTKEFTSLEPGVIEYKYYAAGVGLLKTEMAKGGNDVEVLTSIRH
ncbi:MAG TPA: hypothetical protein VM187_03570 [Niastella sp.]|nr:hypothetical protein [Niastella sp.]